MRAEPDHAAIVLAAGLSRRLGEPKQLLRVAGETLLARSVRLARSTRPRRLRAVIPPSLRDACQHLDAELIVGEGGLSDSVAAGLGGLDDVARALLLPCDLPRLRPEHLVQLLDAAAAAPSRIAVTDHAGRPGIPVVIPAPFRRWCVPASGDRGLQAALMRIEAGQLGWVSAVELSTDLDTPTALAMAREAGWVDPAGDDVGMPAPR